MRMYSSCICSRLEFKMPRVGVQRDEVVIRVVKMPKGAPRPQPEEIDAVSEDINYNIALCHSMVHV